MRIAIDTVPLLSPFTGVGNYLYQISRHLRGMDPAHEYTYFYGYYSSKLLSPGQSPDSVYRLKEALRRLPVLGEAARGLKGLANLFSSREFDLYFEPNFIPLNIRARRTVVTVPDFSFARFPQWHTPDKVRYYAKNFWEKIRRADRVIFISRFIRQEAVERFGFAPDQSAVIPLGYDREIFRPYPANDLIPLRTRYDLPEKFILFVGSIEPRKNLKNLLRAYLDLEAGLRKDHKLVLAGFKGWKNEEVMGMIRGGGSDIRYLGYVPEPDLAGIYSLARLFVYPSFYEGFGLPPLEAMACGCPVVVSDAASLPEVCGDGAHYVDPADAADIGKGMERVLADGAFRAGLVDRGLRRAAGFSWEASARAHLRLFEEVGAS